jgi:predicted O-methyltransferase YrrM
MSLSGTDSYEGAEGLPPLVLRALGLARELGFPSSCRVEQGRLLHALAAGAATKIGETGTGCGVGLAWLASGRRAGVSITTVERDAERAGRVRELFADVPDVEVIHDDYTAILRDVPFDLLVVDGGGNGKQTPAVRPSEVLSPFGSIVIDDFTPMASWPPTYHGAPDEARIGWLSHPELLCTEVRLAPDLSTIIGTYRP